VPGAASDAVAASAIAVPDVKLLPVAGEVILTVGGVLGATTVTDTAADVVTAPLLSVALAVMLCAPTAAPVQLKLNLPCPVQHRLQLLQVL
jgi:hypothetical protein